MHSVVESAPKKHNKRGNPRSVEPRKRECQGCELKAHLDVLLKEVVQFLAQRARVVAFGSKTAENHPNMKHQQTPTTL
jgi:hypothetical protein